MDLREFQQLLHAQKRLCIDYYETVISQSQKKKQQKKKKCSSLPEEEKEEEEENIRTLCSSLWSAHESNQSALWLRNMHLRCICNRFVVAQQALTMHLHLGTF